MRSIYYNSTKGKEVTTETINKSAIWWLIVIKLSTEFMTRDGKHGKFYYEKLDESLRIVIEN